MKTEDLFVDAVKSAQWILTQFVARMEKRIPMNVLCVRKDVGLGGIWE